MTAKPKVHKNEQGFMSDVPLCRAFRVGIDNMLEIYKAGVIVNDDTKVTCKRCLKLINKGRK